MTFGRTRTLTALVFIFLAAIPLPAGAEVIRLRCEPRDGSAAQDTTPWKDPIKITVDTDRKVLELFASGDFLMLSTVNSQRRAAELGHDFSFEVTATRFLISDIWGAAHPEYFSGSIDRETGFASFSFATPRNRQGGRYSFRGNCQALPDAPKPKF